MLTEVSGYKGHRAVAVQQGLRVLAQAAGGAPELAHGLPGVVAHGMWTMGAGLKVVTDWVGDPARVLGYFVRFTRPVVVPDTDEGVEVVYRATVADVADGVAKLSITAECGDDQVLGAARAEVRVD